MFAGVRGIADNTRPDEGGHTALDAKLYAYHVTNSNAPSSDEIAGVRVLYVMF